MKKSAQEIYDKLRGCCDECKLPNEEDVLDAMEEYAEQFKPKWISTNNLHHVNMKVKTGWYALRLTDEFGIIHQDIKHIKNSIPTKWHFYCPIILPEKPEQ